MEKQRFFKFIENLDGFDYKKNDEIELIWKLFVGNEEDQDSIDIL